MAPCLTLKSYPVPHTAFDTLAVQAQASKAIFLYTKPWKLANHGVHVLGCPSAGILPIEDVASLRATERFLA